MGEEEKVFSNSQRHFIYDEYLKNIKVEISEILLYDTEAAMRFLQEYNSILKCTNEKEILSRINKLESDLDSYKNDIGGQKSFEDKSKAIIQQIEDMQVDGDRLSLDDFEAEFNRLKRTYQTTFQKYSFQERDIIEQQLYKLYGRVMVRRVREGKMDEVEIPEEDVAGLTIFMNNEIYKLSQNANPKVQNAIERIKFKLIDGKNAFQSDEIWRLLSYAQSQKYVGLNQPPKETKQPQVTALAVVNEKKGLASRVKKAFQKEPQLPLQVEDLSKITLDWLAQYIPKDMLTKIEDERLEEEGKEIESKYLPDSKTAIYELVARPSSFEPLIGDKFEYKDNDGNENMISFRYSAMAWIPIYLDEKNMKRMTKSIGVDTEEVGTETLLEYAMFLDNIFGTNFANDLARDYGEFIQNPKSTLVSKMGYEYGYVARDFVAKSKLFKNLLKSYNSIAKECKATEENFRADEESNRRRFYEKSSFKEDIKQGTDDQQGTDSQYILEQGFNEIAEEPNAQPKQGTDGR